MRLCFTRIPHFERAENRRAECVFSHCRNACSLCRFRGLSVHFIIVFNRVSKHERYMTAQRNIPEITGFNASIKIKNGYCRLNYAMYS